MRRSIFVLSVVFALLFSLQSVWSQSDSEDSSETAAAAGTGSIGSVAAAALSSSSSDSSDGNIGGIFEELILELLIDENGEINEVAFALFIENYSNALREALTSGVDNPFIVALRGAILQTVLMGGTPAPTTSTTASPTSPTPLPTAPTPLPTAPTPLPTAPTPLPTAPTPLPTAPTPLPTAPTATANPTQAPGTPFPSFSPSPFPSPAPTAQPTFSTRTCSNDAVFGTALGLQGRFEYIVNIGEGVRQTTFVVDSNTSMPIMDIISATNSQLSADQVYFLSDAPNGNQLIYSVQIPSLLNSAERGVNTSASLIANISGDFDFQSLIFTCFGEFLAADFAGNLYVIDPSNSAVRQIGTAETPDFQQFASPYTWNFDTQTLIQITNNPNNMNSTLNEYQIGCPSTLIRSSRIDSFSDCGDGDISAITYIGSGQYMVFCSTSSPNTLPSQPNVALVDATDSTDIFVAGTSANQAQNLFPEFDSDPISQAFGILPICDGDQFGMSTESCPILDELPTCPPLA